ncbi:MAG TPA: metal ABC transporter permease [Gammaproteobacteria bacterium]|nr:metal ABC transporter permease [Gammaproteobacteria bacterium]
MSLDSVDFTIIGPALVAGILVLATHVPMGREVLNRGIIFIDLAIAQVAGMGVIAADTFHLGASHGWTVQAAAGIAALIGALLLTWTERKFPDIQEALIGVLFALAATGSILLLANNPQGGEHLKDLLVGQILWVSYASLMPVAVLYALILAAWFGLRWRIGRIGFYVLFALMVTASVQLVGVYLVFASLIVPALGARGLPEKRGLAAAFVLGVIGYAIGLILSTVFDLPSGALIVWCLAGLAIIMGLVRKFLPVTDALEAHA